MRAKRLRCSSLRATGMCSGWSWSVWIPQRGRWSASILTGRSGISIMRDTAACYASKLPHEVAEAALVRMIEPFGLLLYGALSLCLARSRST